MNICTRIFKSSLGRKYVMAVTGFVLFGFVVGHLAGNLQIFLGAEAINRYGHFLQSNPELIWPTRLFLLLMVGLHVWSAATLSSENKKARPVDYGEYKPVGSTYASRTMLMTGLIVGCFIIYHLLHFTFQVKAINGTGKDFREFNEPLPALVAAAATPDAAAPVAGTHAHGRHDIYKMMVVGFSNWLVTGFYVLGMALLCLHLSHGIASMFQSLGWTNTAYRPFLENGARLIAIVIFLGYISIPLAVRLGGFGKEVLK